MKAKLGFDGTLTIKAETEIESYALQKWSDENKNLPKGLLVFWGIEKIQPVNSLDPSPAAVSDGSEA